MLAGMFRRSRTCCCSGVSCGWKVCTLWSPPFDVVEDAQDAGSTGRWAVAQFGVERDTGEALGFHRGPVTSLGERIGQLHRRLRRPPKRRHRIPPSQRIHQRVQRRPHPRILTLRRRTPRALDPNPPISDQPRLQLRHTLADRVRRCPHRRRHQLDPTPAELASPRTCQHPPRPLIQNRRRLCQHPRQRGSERRTETRRLPGHCNNIRDLRHSRRLETIHAQTQLTLA